MTQIAPSMWLGPIHSEAKSAFKRAREAGLSPLRALVVGTLGSFKECWAFRSTIAEHLGCSIRTVQRALTQAASEGLIGKARAKPNEKPPGLDKPMPCGWSHRWVIGWGKAGQAVEQAVAAARARWMVKHATPAVSRPPAATQAPARPAERPRSPYHGRRMTAADIDAELERLARTVPAPEPGG